ncbi:hypothetical protein MRX96_042865, partial [Rhipicephalus microplus]
ESFGEKRGPPYPFPASQNTLYLVGYSRPLNKSEYSCVASKYDTIGGRIYPPHFASEKGTGK